jgi:hypothetical protein
LLFIFVFLLGSTTISHSCEQEPVYITLEADTTAVDVMTSSNVIIRSEHYLSWEDTSIISMGRFFGAGEGGVFLYEITEKTLRPVVTNIVVTDDYGKKVKINLDLRNIPEPPKQNRYQSFSRPAIKGQCGIKEQVKYHS